MKKDANATKAKETAQKAKSTEPVTVLKPVQEPVTEHPNRELIDSLIAHKQTSFTEVDRVLLESLPLEALNKMLPKQKVAKVKEVKYTRIDSSCEAIKQNPATIEAWVKLADELYVKHGGTSNPKESQDTVNRVARILPHFETGYAVPIE